jgi:hypothetical protein
LVDNSTAIERLGVGPEVIADAATARRPKTRYVAPRNARIMLRLQRFVPDRAMDAITRARDAVHVSEQTRWRRSAQGVATGRFRRAGCSG